MTLPQELWDNVFFHLNADPLASIRLMRAAAHLWRMQRNNKEFWVRMESLLPNHNRYLAYKAVNKHLGIQKRVLAWANYCDSGCSKCQVDLFGMCTGTFPVRLKLCYKCKGHELIAETALDTWFPYWRAAPGRKSLRYCWVTLPSGQKTRHYASRDIHRLILY